MINRNKKTGKELRRVFVHGVFVRPEKGPDEQQIETSSNHFR